MVTEMLKKVDLQCSRCSKKIKEIITEIPREIRDQVYHKRKNLVWITVLGCSPEKIRDKIIRKGGKTVQSVEIVPAKPKEPEKPPEKPKEPEKIRDEIIRKGGKTVQSVEIVPAKPKEPEKKPEKPPEKKPEKPKEPEKKPEKPKEPEKKPKKPEKPPEKPKEPEKPPEKPKEPEKPPEKKPEKKPEKPKEPEKPPEKPKEPEKKPEKPKVRENHPVRPLSREDSSDGNNEKEVRENPPVRPLNREDSSDGDDEKIRRERTSPREDDSDTFFSICDEDEESGAEVDVGNTPSPYISEPVDDVSPHGSSRRRITSWEKGKRKEPEKPEVRENPPVRRLSREDSSDGNDEKEVFENPSANSSEPVHDVSPHGSSRRRITSWQKGELLGSGSNGRVYKGFDNHDKSFFAIKEVSLLDPGRRGEERLSRLQQEISLLSQLDHKNIVRYLGSDKDDTNLYVFLELMTEGSLETLYRKFKLGDSQVSAYTRQILNGLKYLHDREVVHRDIKCANILVDVRGSVKLADFGLAKAIEKNSAKSSIGSGHWMAPEVVDQKRRSSQLNRSYGLEADIWSLGCTVLEMLTRQYPYPGLEPQAMFKSGRGEPPQVPDSLSREAQDLILRCLKVNPNGRPTAAELLDHPFVRN